jgi:rubrerythrin
MSFNIDELKLQRKKKFYIWECKNCHTEFEFMKNVEPVRCPWCKDVKHIKRFICIKERWVFCKRRKMNIL